MDTFDANNAQGVVSDPGGIAVVTNYTTPSRRRWRSNRWRWWRWHSSNTTIKEYSKYITNNKQADNRQGVHNLRYNSR
jgi:hypothetical protein